MVKYSFMVPLRISTIIFFDPCCFMVTLNLNIQYNFKKQSKYFWGLIIALRIFYGIFTLLFCLPISLYCLAQTVNFGLIICCDIWTTRLIDINIEKSTMACGKNLHFGGIWKYHTIHKVQEVTNISIIHESSQAAHPAVSVNATPPPMLLSLCWLQSGLPTIL